MLLDQNEFMMNMLCNNETGESLGKGLGHVTDMRLVAWFVTCVFILR